VKPRRKEERMRQKHKPRNQAKVATLCEFDVGIIIHP